MSALSDALTYRRLTESDATVQLLRSPNAPVILALLATHLGDTSRRRDSDELAELIDGDLDELREHFPLPLNGKGYCTAWRNAGWLIRRPAGDKRSETLELSPEALAAIRIMEQIALPRSSATESRLVSIRDQLRRLAAESDPDGVRRLEQLERDRNELDERIARIQAGHIDVIDADRAGERLIEILRQAEDVPADFGRVRARFEQLNHDLRISIVESEDTQRSVLDDIFRGVDVIEGSDEGKTFDAFSRLVLDAELAAAFEDDIDVVLDRDLAKALTAQERRFLRGFTRTLKDGSGEIHGVLTEFARGLRRYVQSQDYQRDRVLRESLREALAVGLGAARHIKPYQQTGQLLPLSSVTLSSVGSVTLHDPGEYVTETEIIEHTLNVADIEALRHLARETEIDFGELRNNTNELLSETGRPLTVGGILTSRPATQGVASVIGLISLAVTHGASREDATETVTWQGLDKHWRSAQIPTYTFSERLPQ
ncbi:MAG: DUF3375 domain-containing protein [Rhodoglobus sp.]